MNRISTIFWVHHTDVCLLKTDDKRRSLFLFTSSSVWDVVLHAAIMTPSPSIQLCAIASSRLLHPHAQVIISYWISEVNRSIERLKSFKGCGMGPWLVLVSPCFRENAVATCKIGSFLCSLDNLLQKNVIVLVFGNQISKWRSFEKKGYFWPIFHIF